jgi:hypothetical protein
MEVVRKRRLTRGEAHVEVERAVADRSLAQLAALALFDDADRAADVAARLAKDAGEPLAGAFQRCDEGAAAAPAETVDLVRLTSRLVAWFRGLS